MFNSGNCNMPFSMDVVPAGYNNGNNGFGGDWAWWVVILLIFGWNNGGWGGFGNNGGGALTRGELCQDMNFNDLQSGVRGIQSTLADGFRNIDNAVCTLGYQGAQLANATQMQIANGFGTLDTSLCQLGNNISQTQNALAAQIAACCCDVREGISGVNYNLATQAGGISRDIERGFANTNFAMSQQNCATLQAIEKASDRVIDYLCNKETQNLRDENFALKLSASQERQNNYLVRELSPKCPIPAFLTCNPYTGQSYTNGYGYGNVYGNGCCGCGA